MAEELKRKKRDTVILALHPGEVETWVFNYLNHLHYFRGTAALSKHENFSDMSKIEIAWEISGGQITAEESIHGMLDVIQSKTIEHTGTFWTWQNEVSQDILLR